MPPGEVDVDGDVLVRVIGLEVEELRDDEVRDLVVDRRAEKDDPLVEQTRIDVEQRASPRDVCSMTMGMSGLIRLPSSLGGTEDGVS